MALGVSRSLVLGGVPLAVVIHVLPEFLDSPDDDKRAQSLLYRECLKLANAGQVACGNLTGVVTVLLRPPWKFSPATPTDHQSNATAA